MSFKEVLGLVALFILCVCVLVLPLHLSREKWQRRAFEALENYHTCLKTPDAEEEKIYIP